MSRFLRRRVVVAFLAAALAAPAAACGDSSGSGSTLPPDVAVILDEAVAAMTATESLVFALTRGGAPITVANLQFDSAEGEYAAPDSAQAVLKVKAADLSVEVATIAIGERVWLTNPLSQQWEEFPEGTGFNPAIIFDPEIGWQPLLGEDLDGETLAEELEDGNYVVTGTVAPSRVEVLTAGLVSDQAVEVELWIDAETATVTRVAFNTTGADGVSEWLLELSDFGEPVTIEPPV